VQTSIIVVKLIIQTSTSLNGIVVDTINEVLAIEKSNIKPVPQYETDVDQAFLMGMGKVNDILTCKNLFNPIKGDILK